MKKLLLATSCLALTSTMSMAADMSVPYTKAPVMPAQVFTWTGCYVGLHGGGGSMTSSNADSSNSEGGTGLNSALNGKGAVAGGQAGCNYQDGNWVIGVEGEGYWSNIKISNTSKFFFNGVLDDSEGTTVKNNNDFTIAARAGFAMDRTFVYGKAGWAWGSIKTNSFDTCCSTGGTATFTSNSAGTLDGLMVGVGIEHALTRNWTVKLEYDYIAFGNKEVAFTTCNSGVPCTTNSTFSFSANKQLFKVGANYLFDFGGPVAGKY